MSILNGPAVAALLNPRAQLVDNQGTPTTSYGVGFLTALYKRTGSGTGIQPTVSGQLTGTGTTSATALGLINDWNLVSGGGVIISPLLNLQPGNDIWVYNNGAGNINVFPPSGAIQIDQLSAGSPFVLGGHKLRCFQCWTSKLFVSYGN